jgi:biopolymer transport protein ExbD
MIAIWMVYAAFIGLVVFGVGRAIEELARLADRPRRWVWVGAMVLSLGVPLALFAIPSLGAARRVMIEPGQVVADAGAPASLPPSRPALESAAIRGVQGDRLWMMSPVYGEVALAGWIVLSLLLGGRLLFAAGRLSGRRQEWQRAILGGTPLLVSADAGPAVIGLRRPEIVVPAWAAELDDDALAMLIEHERQHVAARDAWLAVLAEVLVALVPWHVGLWLQRRRLQRAIELDCDRRVLARGASRIRYGRLLVDVSERLAGWQAPVLVAFTERRSELSERIEVLAGRLPRPTIGRVTWALGVVGLMVTVACLSPRPLPFENGQDTTLRVHLIPVAPPLTAAGSTAVRESAARALIAEGLERLGANGGTVGPIDRLTIVRDRQHRIVEVFGSGSGPTPATDGALRNLDPNAIAAVNVTKGPRGTPDLIVITLKDVVRDSAAWQRQTKPRTPSTDITLRIRGPGRISINDQPVPFEELERTLHAVYDRRPRKDLFVQADSTVSYQHLTAVLDVARRANVRVLLRARDSD